MKKIFIVFSIFILGFSYAQEIISYKNNGKTISFKISEDEYFIKSSLPPIGMEYKKISNNYGIVKKKIKSVPYINRKEILKKETNIQFDRIEPILLDVDTETKLMIDGQINIKMKSNIDVKSLFGKYNFTIEQNKLDTNVYLLKSNNYSTQEIFDIVNKFQNNPSIEFIEPNFIVLVSVQQISNIPNDTYYNNQWALENMKVDKAWQYSRGAGIKIAVIDDGVDLQHIDLKDNLLVGYDATGNGSKGDITRTGILGENSHGTACAGIIGAVGNNSIGISGVAYEAKILPVRIATSLSNGSMITSYAQIANGINWAWQNGADILSNSWSNNTYSSIIENAIKNAVEKGRNGKGSIVFFSSGNKNADVSFPANLPNVIAVGASSMCDERKSPTSCDFENWGSNYGSQLDLVAPGVNIYTTDISGANGYTYDDYKSNFNGTSSACPNAAGVMALILSTNPNLTQKEARDILEQSTDKVRSDLYQYQIINGYDNGTWNNEVGYGRVNALKAIQKVLAQNFNIQGNSVICDNTTQTYGADMNVRWELSNDIEKVSETSNSIIIRPKQGFNGFATLKAINGGVETTKKIWVGSAPLFFEMYTFDDDKYAQFKLVSREPELSLEDFGIDQNSLTCQYTFVPNFNAVLHSGDCRGMTIQAHPNNTTDPMVGLSIEVKSKPNNGCLNINWVGTMTAKNHNVAHHIYTVSPNPARDVVHISLSNLATTQNKMKTTTSVAQRLNTPTYGELFDYMGKRVAQVQITNGKAQLNVSRLKGTYILTITTNGHTEQHKIIVK